MSKSKKQIEATKRLEKKLEGVSRDPEITSMVKKMFEEIKALEKESPNELHHIKMRCISFHRR